VVTPRVGYTVSMATTTAQTLIDAHFHLKTVDVSEPECDEETDMPLDAKAWMSWHEHEYKPAYAAWTTAIEEFRQATGYEGSSHPFNILPAAHAVLDGAKS
jgi:hypothetical protein